MHYSPMPNMDMSSSIDNIEIPIPSCLISLYNFTLYVLSLLFLLCYQYPKITFSVGMVLSYFAISTVLDAIIRAFFTAPINRFPLAIALILAAIAWYMHRLIKENDEMVMRDALQAADLAAARQLRYLGVGDGYGSRSSSSSEEEGEQEALTRERASLGGLDLDVWQGGERIKRRGWTPKKI
ncbi:hypothetical protein VTL71DRAFT_10381 [Oculimacula yallundae]|uniref:Uncharacterized protein n=1 Tax=Oculimacula yallundae TaxID=86028 RepID=A0ABR4CTD8_9HELO